MSIATLAEAKSWLGITATATADDNVILGVLLASVDALFTEFLGYSISQATRTEYYPPRVNLTQRDALVDGYERSGTNKVVPIDRYRNERRVIMLRHLPVRSITAVYENPDAWLSSPPDFSSQFLLTAGSGYSLDCDGVDDDGNNISKTGFLIRESGPWSVAERCVKVTYVGGYSATELGSTYGHLKHAFLTQIQVSYNAVKLHRMEGRAMGGMPGILASVSLGDWSESYDTLTAQKLYGLQTALAPAVMEMLEKRINYSAFL